ncbi:RNA polymerase II C-terminal domain phosphatase-like 3 [Senna tora]|uniref:protein-serine/threonine phosphatase n=1 Tax=Senna tora TaxID=362788 RepID=A0A834X7Z6_9FABA|nr:RNA polymerase II C-terminal domain phosphatase-like 3 [Senna tora]
MMTRPILTNPLRFMRFVQVKAVPTGPIKETVIVVEKILPKSKAPIQVRGVGGHGVPPLRSPDVELKFKVFSGLAFSLSCVILCLVFLFVRALLRLDLTNKLRSPTLPNRSHTKFSQFDGACSFEDVEEGEISDTASVEEITEEDFNNQDLNLTKRKGDARVWAELSNPREKEVNNGSMDDSVQVLDVGKEDGELEEVIENVTVANAEKSFAETCCQLQSALQSLTELFSASSVSQKDVLIQKSFHAIEVVNSVFSSINHAQSEKSRDSILRLLSFAKNQCTPIFSSDHMEKIQSMICSLDSIDCDSLSSSGATSKDKELQIDEVRDKVMPALSAEELISSSKPSDPMAPGTSVNNNTIEISEISKSAQSNVKGRGILLPLLDLHKDHDVDSLPSPTRETPSCFPVHKAFSVGEGLVKSSVLSTKIEPDIENSKLHHYETDALRAVSTYQQKFGGGSFLMNDKLPSPTPSDNYEDGAADTYEEVSSVSRAGSLGSFKPSVLDQPSVSSTAMDKSTMLGLINSRNDAPTASVSSAVKSSAKSRDPRLRFINSDASALDLNRNPLMQNSTKVENFGTAISKKQKAVEVPCLDVAVTKRQKNGLENPVNNTREVRTASGIGGWLEETTTVGSQLINKNQLMENVETESKIIANAINNPCTGSGTFNVTSSGNELAPASLPALLKDIAVNPSMLLSLLLGHKKVSADAEKKSADSASASAVVHPPNSNSIMGADTMVSSGPSKTTGLLQTSVGIPLASSQVTSMAQSIQDDSAKIHMKPRDPRRILHGNMGSEQFKAIVPPLSNTLATGDNVTTPKLDVRADTKLVPSQSISAPDIARQFTRNLKNIADIMSVSQVSSNHLTIPQSFSSASGPRESDRVEQKSVVSNSENLHAGPGSATEVAVAGSSRSASTWGDVEHLFEGYDEQQKAAIQRERARRIEEQKKMFAARKLCLVLDLDHTLLNSAKFVEVDPVHDEILRKKEEQDREKAQRQLFRFPHMGMWTKLRPGIWNFLEKASKLFEMHLYTMGNKLYATQMAKVLDPKGVLFAGRVISRGDDTDLPDGDERVPKSKDLEGVLGMESAVVIIDDSVKVWPHNKLNLIVVERYTYFPCSRRQFGLPGPSLLEIDHDERPEDGTLASSLAVIERIHHNFFASQSLEEADVRNILASEQRKILAGCRIVFSRVFPVGEANPHLHPLWQTAEQFGAVCTNQIDDQVTHVVANSLGTDKVNWALSNNRFVVHPGWVEASALLYRRANEQDFAIKP